MIVIINAKSTSFSNTVTILQVFIYAKKVSREIFVSLSTVTDRSKKNAPLYKYYNPVLQYFAKIKIISLLRFFVFIFII